MTARDTEAGTTDFSARPRRIDVVNAYRLALGRDPEDEGVVDDRLGQPNSLWFPPFFASGEYRETIVDRIVARQPLLGDWFGRPPEPAFTAWVAEFVPLGAQARTAAAAATDWPALFHALYSDPVFQETVLSRAEEPADPAFLAELETRHRLSLSVTVKGAIDAATDDEVHGWAIDVRDPARAPTLELFIDGRFAAAATTDRPRPDLDLAGRPGFVLRYAVPETAARTLIGEVRDLATGAVIGSIRLPGSRRPMIDALAETRRELAEVRALLDRIEQRLPDVHRSFGYPLSAWDVYFDTYYAEAPAPGGAVTVHATVMVDSSTASVADLDATLASLFAQRAWPVAIVMLHDGGDSAIEVGLRLDAWRARFGGRVAITDIVTPRGDVVGLVSATATTPYLIACRNCGRFAPDAIERLVGTLAAGAAIAFADDDLLVEDEGGRTRHADPRLRGAFDPDLLLQHDSIGPLVGIATAAVDRSGARGIVDLALRAVEAGLGDRIVHVPRVLLHRTPAAPDAELHHDAVRAHLARVAPALIVDRHRDPLGAEIGDALRIQQPIAAETRVAIIVPTRDRIDLLGPCIDSIVRSIPHNRVAIQIAIVDNRSAEAATHAFLAGYRNAAAVRVLPHDGAFNWAAINNRAAAAVDADVLVFLNNDTVVLSPDCWDVLAAQALRPEVGAVGGRLLYADGTIQHAGIVMDPWHSFASHEGVGDAGSDAGYLGRNTLVRRVSTVTGACLATRAALFRDVGGFDTVAFPVEGNDTDYCLRLRDQGLAILYDPGATLYHFESRTRGHNDDEAKRRRAYRATQVLRSRWSARFEQDPFYNGHFDRLAPPFTRLQPPPR